MSVKETLEFTFEADNSDVKKKLNESRDDIEGFKKRIQDGEAIKLSMNVAVIQKQLELLKGKLKKAKDSGDLEAEIKISADIQRMQNSLTQSKRELRNYVRTGEKDISVLWKLFDNVGRDIDRARLELLKMGKSTKDLDRLEKGVNDLNKEFRAGKVSAEDYGRRLNQMQWQINGWTKSLELLKNTLKSISGLLIAWLWVRQLSRFVMDSVRVFADFEKGLARINTVARVTKAELQGLGEEVKNLSVRYGQARDELLDTAFNITSAGVEFQNVSALLELSSQVAVGAATDTTTAFNGIIAVVKKYGLDLQESQMIAEQFFITNELGQTTIGDLATAMQNLTSTVAIAGIKTNELFAVYSALTWVTGNANQVTTQLNGAINALAAPTINARRLFDELGIEVGQAAIEQKWFVEVAKDVFDATNGNLELLRRLIPEVEAQKAIVALATTQYDKFTESAEILAENQWALENAVNEMANTTDQRLAEITNAWDNFKVGVWKQATEIWFILVRLGQFWMASWKVLVWWLVLAMAEFWKFWIYLYQWGKDIRQNWSAVTGSFQPLFRRAMNWLPQILNSGIKRLFWKFWETGEKMRAALGLDKLDDFKIFEDPGELPEFTFSNLNAAQERYGNANSALKDGILEQVEVLKNFWKTGRDEVNSVNIMSQLFWSELGGLWDLAEGTGDKLEDMWKKGAGAAKKATEEEDEYQRAIEEAKKLKEEQHKITMTALKEMAGENSRAYGSIMKDIENGVKAFEKYLDAIDKAKEEIKKFRDDAVSNLRDINNELSEIGTDRDENLARRRLRILEEQAALEKEMQEIRSQSELQTGQPQRLLEIDRQRAELSRELQIIEKNANEEILERIALYESLSEAEKILQDAAERTAEANERKMIYEAIANGEKISLDEISNYKNLRLAEDLMARQEALNSELETQEANLEAQKDLLENFYNQAKEMREEEKRQYERILEGKKQAEREFTKFMAEEIRKRAEMANSIRSQANEIGDRMNTTSSAPATTWVANENPRNVTINQNNYNTVDFQQWLREINRNL